MNARGAADFLTRTTKWLAVVFVMLAIVLAALAVRQTTGGKIDDTLDRTVAPASDPLAPVAPQGGDLTAPVVDGPAPPQPSATADDPLADVAN